MKILIPAALALFLLFSDHGATRAASSEPALILPENLAARGAMAASQKTLTIFIREKEPEKATVLLNTTNEDYAKKGWTVFSILPFIHEEDFQGFFITYQKSLIIE